MSIIGPPSIYLRAFEAASTAILTALSMKLQAGPFLPSQASPPLSQALCEKPQACPPLLTKSCQKAINILIQLHQRQPPSRRKARLFVFSTLVSAALLISPGPVVSSVSFPCAPVVSCGFPGGTGVERCGQEGPPLHPSIKYYSSGLRAPLAAAPARLMQRPERQTVPKTHLLCRLSIH